jgi:hypothetical protein
MVGTLGGRVDDSLMPAAPPPGTPSCEPSVYLYDGAPTSEPVDGSAEPLATAMVNERIVNLETEYHYEIGFLLAGDYKVAFTCDDGATLTPETGKAATITQQSIENDEVIVVDLP